MKKFKIISNQRALSLIKSPIMTEKSTNLNQFNKYSFFVSTSKRKIIGHSYSIDMIREQIVEASLSRIYRDFKENEFGIITSWRVGNKDNRANLSKLKSAVRGSGFGYVRIDGVGQEEDENGKVKSVKEPSLLVKNSKAGGGPLMDTNSFEKFIDRKSVV